MTTESNNIYNNMLDDDNDSSDDEQMIFQMDFNESDEYDEYKNNDIILDVLLN